MRHPKKIAPFPRTSSVAAILAASLTAAALARAARADTEPLKVETTLHVLASIAKEVGGDGVEAEALARSTEDPHQVTATAEHLVQVRGADAFVESGVRLEPWDQGLVDGAHPKIRRSGDAFCSAGDGRPVLEAPRGATVRGAGDLHPSGNPHLWYEPFVGHVYARNIEACLGQIQPEKASTWRKNRQAFDKKLDEAIFGKELCAIVGGGERLARLHREGKLDEFLSQHQHEGKPLAHYLGGLLKKARPLRGARLVSSRASWVYFEETYGCVRVGELEPRPGSPPTRGHLEELAAKARREGARVVLVASYEPRAAAEDFAARIGGTVVVVPSDVGAEGTRDWFDFQEQLVARVVAALEGSGGGEPG